MALIVVGASAHMAAFFFMACSASRHRSRLLQRYLAIVVFPLGKALSVAPGVLLCQALEANQAL